MVFRPWPTAVSGIPTLARVAEWGISELTEGRSKPCLPVFLCRDCLCSQAEAERNSSRVGGTAKEQRIPETTTFLSLPWGTIFI